MINNIKKVLKRGMRLIPASLFSKRSLMNTHEARHNLSSFSPKPDTLPFANNEIVSFSHDLQIIIPAYNAALWLEDCINSILSQKTKYTYKIVLIDDGSTDRTPLIADNYSNNENILVIHQANKGFSGARNTGLKKLFGKYIMFVDSDDMLYPRAIESLLSAAYTYDSDIVEGGAFSFRNRKKTRVAFSHNKTKVIPYATGVMHGQPWAKVYKATCFEHIVFPECFWYEDSVLSFLIYPECKHFCVINDFTYLYRSNPLGISSTSRGKPKAIDTYWITEMLMECKYNTGHHMDSIFFDKYLRQLVLNQHRLKRLPEYIQESAFILSADMMNQYFSADVINEKRHVDLVKIIFEKDWGAYKLYCACH